MDQEDAKLVKSLGQAIATATESTFSISFVEKVVLYKSYGVLWSQLSELQIIEHFDLFYLKTPSTWSTFSTNIQKITRFDYLVPE